ncbi:hypothetical protein TNCT_242021 [Trichonephila clavata]|uniref:Uncharacterized protein n=1 Tax=Trichonephila clavata TaxID=2740835 RepID=A0A8X6FZR2_TRICU|nr:hypothetical protein TNCT_242021 [Trichonephila clavata]
MLYYYLIICMHNAVGKGEYRILKIERFIPEAFKCHNSAEYVLFIERLWILQSRSKQSNCSAPLESSWSYFQFISFGIKKSEEFSKQIVLHWIPGGVTGNELADHLAKMGASIQQTTRKAIPFTSDKCIIRKKDERLHFSSVHREKFQ